MSLVQLVLRKAVFDRLKHGLHIFLSLTEALDEVFQLLGVDHSLRHREMLDHVVDLLLELDLDFGFLSEFLGVRILVGSHDLGGDVDLVE